MINIRQKLWAVKGYNREVEDSEHLLAYMTHAEYTKENEIASSFKGRQHTGLDWAKPRYGGGKWVDDEWVVDKEFKYVPDILEFDNSPAIGFRIVGSATRWSTDNKVIRVEDPRGFVVEIPTSNLTTLLKHTIVNHGEVTEACVWGREHNNHILLPVNSEVYKQAVTQTTQHNTKVSLTKIEVGQVVKFSVEDENEYIYLGRGKAVWEIQTKQAKLSAENRWYYSRRYEYHVSDPSIADPYLIEDNKLCFIFKNKNQRPDHKWLNWEYKTSGQCVVLGKTDETHSVEVFEIGLPERMQKDNFIHRYSCNEHGGVYNAATVKEIKMKEETNV